MSRVGKKPIIIPNNVEVKLQDNKISVKGPKGELSRSINPAIKIKIEDNKILVNREKDDKTSKSLHGLTRTLIANMIEGVTQGFKKILDISGVGYKVQSSGDKLTFQVGFSHPVVIDVPKNIEAKVEGANIIINGIDKEKVGEFSAKVKEIKPVEPYKGKGIKYIGEYVRRKAGKAGKIGTGAIK